MDVDRDVHEAFDARFNDLIDAIPQDEHGFQKGSFRVIVEWTPES